MKQDIWRICNVCRVKYKGAVCPSCFVLNKMKKAKNFIGYPIPPNKILKQPLTSWDGVRQFKFRGKIK